MCCGFFIGSVSCLLISPDLKSWPMQCNNSTRDTCTSYLLGHAGCGARHNRLHFVGNHQPLKFEDHLLRKRNKSYNKERKRMYNNIGMSGYIFCFYFLSFMKEGREKGRKERGLGKGGEPYTEPNTMKTTTESK